MLFGELTSEDEQADEIQESSNILSELWEDTTTGIKGEIIDKSSTVIADRYGDKIKTAAIIGASSLVAILMLLIFDVYLNVKK